MPGPARADVTAVLRGLDIPGIRRALLAWYDANGRDLPFRGTTDPWAVLVSETMAQQTQAARAGEAWRAFMVAFPSPAALAGATPADVLRAWRGLGYNRRALALRAAAVAIVVEHGGRVPDGLEALLRLPGVGPYTARAVLALAYGRPVGAVDTNVRRVSRRLVLRDLPGGGRPGTRPGRSDLDSGEPSPAAIELRPVAVQALADALVDPRRPGDWTHGLMDIGARLCRGAAVDCAACPLEPWCRTAAFRREQTPGDPPLEAPTRRRAAPPAAVREAGASYTATDRWLRGRVVDRLRDASGPEWVRLEGPLGDHDTARVAATLAALERDGLLERHPDDPALVRLPLTATPPGPR
jgi:A/G-specific adenine glycosylase